MTGISTNTSDVISLPAKRKRASLKLPAPVWSCLIAVVLILTAEYMAKAGHVSRFILPAPSEVWSVLWEGFGSGFLVEHTISSAYSTLAGFILGSLLAISVAGVLSSSPQLERIMTPFIVAFQSMPKIAIAPLIVLWLGFGDISKVVIVMVVCFFPIMVNTLQGLKIRDQNQYELFRSLGASRFQTFFGLRLPNAVPYIFAGLRIGSIFALIGTVVGEFVGADQGLGYVMLQSKANFDVPGVYACLLLLMLMGVLLNAAMAFCEQKVSFWTRQLDVD